MHEGTALLAVAIGPTTDGSPRKKTTFGMTEERLTWHLENWAAWQRRRFGEFRRLWYPRKASGNFQCDHSDFDDMVEQADTRCAKAVEAILSDLTVIQECAIHHQLLAAVYNFPRANFEQQYGFARELIRKGLTLRGIF